MTLIRPVQPDDLDSIRNIYNHYVETSVITFDEEPTTTAWWRHKIDRLTTAGLPALVAVDEAGHVLGYALSLPWSEKSAFRYSVENSIYLAPEATGRGLGTELLTALIEASRAVGVRQMIAVITADEVPGSIALHRRFGFVPAGHLEAMGVKFGRELGIEMLQLAL